MKHDSVTILMVIVFILGMFVIWGGFFLFQAHQLQTTVIKDVHDMKKAVDTAKQLQKRLNKDSQQLNRDLDKTTKD